MRIIDDDDDDDIIIIIIPAGVSFRFRLNCSSDWLVPLPGHSFAAVSTESDYCTQYLMCMYCVHSSR